ncbi:MAG: hemerythrin domain-containing protein [Anaeromyxobacteraceae bacterium]
MLTGLGKPSAPSDAVDLLLECHVRIRHFVAMAQRLGEASGTPAPELADTAQRVVRYFGQALPLHVRDEEDSLAPRLRGRDPLLDAAIAAMEREHGEHQPALAMLLAVTSAVAVDPARHPTLAMEVKRAADDLARQFEVHLAQEEAVVLPAVRRLLDAEADAAIVQEMRRRRVGVTGSDPPR